MTLFSIFHLDTSLADDDDEDDDCIVLSAHQRPWTSGGGRLIRLALESPPSSRRQRRRRRSMTMTHPSTTSMTPSQSQSLALSRLSQTSCNNRSYLYLSPFPANLLVVDLLSSKLLARRNHRRIIFPPCLSVQQESFNAKSRVASTVLQLSKTIILGEMGCGCSRCCCCCCC